MKIFRGPSTKDFSDESHEEVSSINLSETLPPWDTVVRVRANITKDAIERQAVAHVEFTRDDLFDLHSRFLEGLIAKADEYDDAYKRVVELMSALMQISHLRSELNSREASDLVQEMIEIAEKVLKREG